jgi:hypothetical protein
MEQYDECRSSDEGTCGLHIDVQLQVEPDVGHQLEWSVDSYYVWRLTWTAITGSAQRPVQRLC